MSLAPNLKLPDGEPLRLPATSDADRIAAWHAKRAKGRDVEERRVPTPSGAIPAVEVSSWAEVPAVLKRILCERERIRIDFPSTPDRSTRRAQREIRGFLQECHGKSFSEYGTQLAEKLNTCPVFQEPQRPFSPAFKDPKDWIEAHGLNYTGPRCQISVTDVYSGASIAAGGVAEAQRVLSEHLASGRPLVTTVDEGAGASSAAAVFKDAVDQNRSLMPAVESARVWKFKDPMGARAKELPRDLSLREFIEESGFTEDDDKAEAEQGKAVRTAPGEDSPDSKKGALVRTESAPPHKVESDPGTVASLIQDSPPAALDLGSKGKELAGQEVCAAPNEDEAGAKSASINGNVEAAAGADEGVEKSFNDLQESGESEGPLILKDKSPDVTDEASKAAGSLMQFCAEHEPKLGVEELILSQMSAGFAAVRTSMIKKSNKAEIHLPQDSSQGSNSLSQGGVERELSGLGVAKETNRHPLREGSVTVDAENRGGAETAQHASVIEPTYKGIERCTLEEILQTNSADNSNKELRDVTTPNLKESESGRPEPCKVPPVEDTSPRGIISENMNGSEKDATSCLTAAAGATSLSCDSKESMSALRVPKRPSVVKRFSPQDEEKLGVDKPTLGLLRYFRSDLNKKLANDRDIQGEEFARCLVQVFQDARPLPAMSRLGSKAQVVIPEEREPFELAEGPAFRILRECKERSFGETVEKLLRSAEKLTELRRGGDRAATTTGARQEQDLVILPEQGNAIFFSDLEGGVQSLAMVIDQYDLIRRWERDQPVVLCVLGDSVDRSETGSLLMEYLLELKVSRGFFDKVIILPGNHELEVSMNYADLWDHDCPNLLADLCRRQYPKGNESEVHAALRAGIESLTPEVALDLQPSMSGVDESVYRERWGLYTLLHSICEILPRSIVSNKGLFAAHAGFPMHGSFESLFQEQQVALPESVDWRKELAHVRIPKKTGGAAAAVYGATNDMIWRDLATTFGLEGQFTALDDPRRIEVPCRPKFTMDDFIRFAKATATSCMIRGHQNNPMRKTETPKQVAALLQARNGEARYVEEEVWVYGNIVTLEHERWAAMLDLSKDRPVAGDFSWIGIVPKVAPDGTTERYLLSLPPLSEAPPKVEKETTTCE